MSQKGFTLVELAIVLMIIGLLIGGVLRGKELLNNARVSSTIKQVTNFDAAYVTFLNAYDAPPGDILSAATRIPGCTSGNTNQCKPGDGDGMVGTPTEIYTGGQDAITTENTQFWKHMALAHLITGVDSGATAPVWGKSHPYGPLHGGFTAAQVNNGGGLQKMDGLVLRLHACLTCGNTEDVGTGTGLGSPASPKQALQIDKKMDDGLPTSGNVQASAYGNGALVADCEEKYNEAREDGFCTMAFLIKK